MGQEQVIVALDMKNADEAVALAQQLAGRVWGFKVHHLLLQEALLNGRNIISELKQYGKVMYDLKHHDVPTTVGDEVAVAAKAGADIITVHAKGGVEMIKEAVKFRQGAMIAAITELTSLTATDILRQSGKTPQQSVSDLAQDAAEGGAQAVVSSPQELEILRNHEDPAVRALKRITPGIRGPNDAKDDQKRFATANEALEWGADLLVVGRPITKAKNPLEALVGLFKNAV